MPNTKKYYWLKLKNDFFTQPKIKKLRRIAGGDTYTCIYLKLMLLTINNNGIIEYEGIESSLEAELSLKLDEDENNISVTISYLFAQNLLTQLDSNNFEINELKGLIGSETATAERMRKSRAKKAKQLTQKSS
ncbi:MAG: phage replisome organizer N-terminal domain-containing protein [Bacteroidota bacterium]|nr:phage replisome organizer N-terminal domain-containing protein [Bacteroidota bacterium]